MTRRTSVFTIAVLVAIVCACSSSDTMTGGGAQNLTVGASAGADFASIQSAVTAATAGSTITIESGTYIESVNINKSLSIFGAGPGTIVEYPPTGVSDEAVIEIRDTFNVRVEGLSVRSTPLMVDGIRVRTSTGIVLRNVVASNNSSDGIDVRGSLGVDVIGSTFESNGGDGLQVDESSGNVRILTCHAASNVDDGIKFRNSSDGLIQDNTSSLNGDDGILVRDATGVEVLTNTATDNTGTGIKVIDAPDTVIQDNTSTGNGSGQVVCEPLPCS